MRSGDEMLNAREAAAYLKINEQTVRRLARENQIPAFKVGGTWRFKSGILDEWAHAQQRRRNPARVMVVDDEQTVRDFVQRALEREGYTVTSAVGGVEALELMEWEVPEVVLLDLKMPGMDGPATLKAIRERHPELPVVLLTGYPDSDLVNRALQHSPLMLLSKPAPAAQIVSTVQGVLKG